MPNKSRVNRFSTIGETFVIPCEWKPWCPSPGRCISGSILPKAQGFSLLSKRFLQRYPVRFSIGGDVRRITALSKRALKVSANGDTKAGAFSGFQPLDWHFVRRQEIYT
jgi:hypothetical protein